MTTEMKGWTFLTGDVCWEDHGAKWCKKAADGAWWVLRFENCESWGDGASGYECDVHRIDISSVPPTEIDAALKSYGWELIRPALIIWCPHSGDVIANLREDPTTFEMVLVDCLDGYGVYAPMGAEAGESYPMRVRAAGRRLAESLMQDETARNTALAKPVNKLGATAADFGRGDSMAPLRRKADAVLRGETPELSPTDRIMLQMYYAAGGRTLGGVKEAGLAAAGAALRKEVDDVDPL